MQYCFYSIKRTLRPVAFAAFAFGSFSLAHSEWTKAFTLRVEEGYDSNVFLQKVGPQANQDSFITVIQPGMDLGWTSKPFNFNLTYAPRISIYGSERTENNVAHNVGLNLKGAITDSLSYEVLNSFAYINGSRTAPTFLEPGGAPAVGGYQLRDRRESLWLKQSAKLTWDLGPVFIRPVYNGYFHDFRTVQKEEKGYGNYVDRDQFNGGVDLGFKVMKDTWFVTGYRYGVQQQDRLFDSPIQYNNTFQRALFGIEGQPAKWIKLCLSGGPSFHHFNDTVPEVMGRNHTRVYVDSTITLTPTALDTFSLAATRFEQMSFYGKGAFEDIVYRAGYARKLTNSLSLKADFRLYRCEFEAPADRKDNIYTPSLGLVWKVNPHLSCDCQYSYEWAESDVADTIGREYGHHLVSLGATLSF